MEINMDNNSFILGTTYLKPNSNDISIIVLLEEIISSLNEQFAATPIIIGGDFNSRIGDLIQLEEEMQLQQNSSISRSRRTCDVTINRRGK